MWWVYQYLSTHTFKKGDLTWLFGFALSAAFSTKETFLPRIVPSATFPQKDLRKKTRNKTSSGL